ncbi:MAG: D-2-hydroxyacid dehydrogenase, partial [Flavitalea sp.]
ILNLVVLDGYTLNPGDLSWEGLRKLGDLVIHDRTSQDKVVERAKDAEVIFTNKTPVGADILNALPKLKYIGVLATGYNIINADTAKKNGVIVSNIPCYGTSSVVQMTFALLMELTNHVQRHSDSVMNGKWSRSVDFCFWDFPLIEIADKTIGIIGFGTIGQKVADVATAFGMNIIAQSRTQTDQVHRKNFKWGSIDVLLQQSDVVSIHCPLTDETKGLINSENLKRMKRSAFLINTSRGPIINDYDLANALNNDTIAGAALDVLSIEPPPKENPLFGAKNCIITPHISWATKEARTRLMETAITNLSAYQQGKPVNVVNK